VSVARRTYRVLMVSNFLPPQVLGGAELMAWQQLVGLASRGHTVCALTADWRDLGLSPASVDGNGPPVTRVPMASKRRRPGRDTGSDPQFEQALAQLLATFQPDIVHFQNMSGLPLRLPRMVHERGVRLVATLHDKWGICPKSTLLKPDLSVCQGARAVACIRCLGKRSAFVTRQVQIALRNRRIRRQLSMFDRLFAPSQYQSDSYVAAGYQASRCRLLPYGIDIGRFHGAGPPRAQPTRPLQLAYLGNLNPHKGAGVLLDALALWPRETVCLVMYGHVDSGQRRWLDEQLARPELAGRVEHRGHLSPTRLPDALAGCDAVAVPSIWPETSSITGMEAMAAHRPVIASRIGGIPEIVDHGQNGLLVAPRDPRSLADAIGFAAQDRERIARFGAEAGKKAKSWSLEIHLDRLENLYEELLGERF
jgi:glycosyltransferase involved in cell wall biosynthesis